MSIRRKGPPTAAASFIRAINEALALRHERKQRAEAEAMGDFLIRLAKSGQKVPYRFLSSIGIIIRWRGKEPPPDHPVGLKQAPVGATLAYINELARAGHGLLQRQSNARAEAAKVKRAEAARRHQEWQALADEVWRRNPNLSGTAAARLIKGKAGASVDRIRRHIRKPPR